MKPLPRALRFLEGPAAGLGALLGLVTLVFVLFCAADQRPPDDHDDFYTASSSWAYLELDQASLSEKPGVLAHHFRGGNLHPRLAQTVLLISMDILGASRLVFRLANLPFLLLLVAGTWLLARELLGHRLALLAAFLAATLPVVINYSHKWDTQFHAAALTPFGLFLLLRCLRGTSGWWAAPWLLFGAWQGLRLYTHPVVSPDIALTLGLAGLFGVVTARSAGLRPVRQLKGWVLGLVSFTAVGGYYIGIFGRAPEHSLIAYIIRRANYADSGFLQQADTASLLGFLYDRSSEVVWLHVMPGYTLLLLPGLLLLPLVLCSRGIWTDAPPQQRSQATLLLLLGLGQLPPTLVATTNNAFLNDWLFVAPLWIILGVLSLSCAASTLGKSRTVLTRAWVVAAVAVGLGHLTVPMASSALGPEPLEQPEYYEGFWLGPYARSTSGRHFTTHHLLSRYEHAPSQLAEQMAETGWVEPGPARYALLDLTWDPASNSQPGCRLGSPDQGWSWGLPPVDGGAGMQEPSPWPFVFAGLRGGRALRVDHELDTSYTDWDVLGREWDSDPEALPGDEGDTGSEAIEHLPPWALVRLWVLPVDRWEEESRACDPRARVPEGVEAGAIAAAAERFPRALVRDTLQDPVGLLIGETVEWDREPAYLGAALLLRFPY